MPPEDLITDPNLITTIQTTSKKIPVLAVNESADLVWDITSELELLQNITAPVFGASGKVKLTVTHRQTSSGEEYYTLKAPRIYQNATGVIVKGLHIKLNTRFVGQQTTFKYLTTSIAANTAVTDDYSLLAAGAMVLLGRPTDQDYLNLAFEILKDGVVPAPPPPALVKFLTSNVIIIDPAKNDPNQFLQSFQIMAMGEVPRPIVISVTDDSTEICGQSPTQPQGTFSSTCLPQINQALESYLSATITDPAKLAANKNFYTARGIVGVGGFNRFDWDFRMLSDSLKLQSAVTSAGDLVPDPTGSISVKFSSDIRREPVNRLLRLRITLATNNGTLTGPGAQQDIYVVFLKENNPDPRLNNEVTYSGLMGSSGILGTKCIKCHNSVLFNGGYDITDYEQMINRKILIPGDEMSLMYRRTNSTDPINIGLSPMPANGGLLEADRTLIKAWIKAGAKNN